MSNEPMDSGIEGVGTANEEFKKGFSSWFWGSMIAATVVHFLIFVAWPSYIAEDLSVTADELDRYCRDSSLAAFKRPRHYTFIQEIPKSPVGKILRRLLISGEYDVESSS